MKADQGHRYSYWVLVGNLLHLEQHVQHDVIHGATDLILAEYCLNDMVSNERPGKIAF